MISFSRLQLLLTLCVSIGYGRTSSGVTFNPTELPTCAIDGAVKPNNRAVRTEGSLLSPHEIDDYLLLSPHEIDYYLKSSSLQAFPANGHPSPSMLHGKCTWMCRGDYTFETKNTFPPPPPNIGHPPVIVCNTAFCLKKPQASNFKRL
jgi:hypothetical protein